MPDVVFARATSGICFYSLQSKIGNRNSKLLHGGIAQLVERQLCKLEVRGSNPLASKPKSELRLAKAIQRSSKLSKLLEVELIRHFRRRERAGISNNGIRTRAGTAGDHLCQRAMEFRTRRKIA